MMLVELFEDSYLIIAGIVAFISLIVYIVINIHENGGKFDFDAELPFIILLILLLAIAWEFIIYVLILMGIAYLILFYGLITPIQFFYKLWTRRKK